MTEELIKVYRKSRFELDKPDQEKMFDEIERAIYKAKDDGREHCTVYVFKEKRENSSGATIELYQPTLRLPEDANYIEDRLIKMGFYCSNKFYRDTLTVFIYFENMFKL